MAIRLLTYFTFPPTMCRLESTVERVCVHGRDESSENKEAGGGRRLQSRYSVKEAPVRTTRGLVEAPGVEPGSEDLPHNGSTCVADRFSFAATHAHRLA